MARGGRGGAVPRAGGVPAPPGGDRDEEALPPLGGRVRKHGSEGMRLFAGGELMPLERMLRQLRDTCGSQAAAVVSRDGLVIAGDMPESISRETFAIMCATILGAGMTAATELRVPSPNHIVLATNETRIHIFDAGPPAANRLRPASAHGGAGGRQRARRDHR